MIQDKEIRELIKDFVMWPENGYMFQAKTLAGEKDGQVYVNKVFSRKPSSRSKYLPTIAWHRQGKNGNTLLDQAMISPICKSMKKDLTGLGYDYYEEVIFPIRDSMLETWRKYLRANGVHEDNYKTKKPWIDAWYKHYIVFDAVEPTTGAIIETDGASFHRNPELDLARDQFVEEVLQEPTKRFLGYGGKPGKAVRDRLELQRYLAEKDPKPGLIERIKEENIQAAVDFYWSDLGFPVFMGKILKRIMSSMDIRRPGWRTELGTLRLAWSTYIKYATEEMVRPLAGVYTKELTKVFKDLFGIRLVFER